MVKFSLYPSQEEISGHKLSFHSLLGESHRLPTADQLDEECGKSGFAEELNGY